MLVIRASLYSMIYRMIENNEGFGQKMKAEKKGEEASAEENWNGFQFSYEMKHAEWLNEYSLNRMNVRKNCFD